MKRIKGPAIFLAQFLGDEAPFDNLENICRWAADLGYKGVQIPTWDKRVIDLKLAAESKDYAQQLKGTVESTGMAITELSTHLQGQLVAVHPAYDTLFDAFVEEDLKGKPKARQEWAVQQLKYAAQASENLGLKACATFSGALLWHTVYPWPQRPAGLVELGFQELGNRWKPILDVYESHGIDLCYEIHAGEDLHDGLTFERFLEEVKHHPRACMLYDPSHFIIQCLDYLSFIDHYHERIKMFHVKDAEFNPSGKQGVYGSYQDWSGRAGRFRSLGDGQVDFVSVFSKLSAYGCDLWAVMEWECVIKSPEQGAREGAPFIQSHIIEVTDKTFDDFAGSATDHARNRKILGLD